MTDGAMTQCPPGSDLMKAWNAYQEKDDFKNSLYWATTDTKMRKERAQELGIDPADNVATSADREARAQGSMWAAFLAGFEAAGGKVRF